ncbi:hypothetical protein ACC808_37045, partial [Rhizobium ruizarguesonis]
NGAGSEYPRSALARFLWDSHDNPYIMANLRKTISRIQARQTELGTVLQITIQQIANRKQTLFRERHGLPGQIDQPQLTK